MTNLKKNDTNIIPVILSGGSGVRLWPLSRANYPKPFHKLLENRSSFESIVSELKYLFPPYIICNNDHRFLVLSQLKNLSINAEKITLEPEGKNTAPAILIAALDLLNKYGNVILFISPSDSYICNWKKMRETIKLAIKSASKGNIVTFSVFPNNPETAYGYIEKGSEIEPGTYKVNKFLEKPSRNIAEQFLESGNYFWNSGIFVASANTIIDELNKYNPTIVDICKKSLKYGKKDNNFYRLEKSYFSQLSSLSFDYALMEKTNKAVTIPLDIQWSDLGTWKSIWEISPKDSNGNVSKGNTISMNVSNSYLHTTGPLITAIDLDNMVIMATKDAVLISDKDKSDNLKQVITEMEKKNSKEHLYSSIVLRPWGGYQSIFEGNGYQVKKLWLDPGQSLSLQYHKFRSEHWVVVSGEASVIKENDMLKLSINESIFIPQGTVHRLSNNSEKLLEVIEVQTGSYLGEDDIIRLEDVYGRIE